MSRDGRDLLDALTDFRFEKKFKNQSQAIRALVEKGLEIYMPMVHNLRKKVQKLWQCDVLLS